MDLSKAVSDLLYRHDCVIVPQFCAFIRYSNGCKWDSSKELLTPSSARIGINTNLMHNDGILVSYWANHFNIDYKSALTQILQESKRWQDQLNKQKLLNVYSVGKIVLNEDGLWDFHQDRNINYCIESFGLYPIKCSKLTSHHVKSKPMPIYAFIKYTAIVVPIILVLSWYFYNNIPLKPSNQAGWGMFFEKLFNKNSPEIKEPDLTIEDINPIENNDVIDNDQINLNTQDFDNKHEKKPSPISYGKYQLISGAFKFEKNAKKLVKNLTLKGYNAAIVGKSGKLHLVAFDTFESKKIAIKNLKVIRKEYPLAWIKIKN